MCVVGFRGEDIERECKSSTREVSNYGELSESGSLQR